MQRRIEVVALDPSSWRLCDAAIDSADATRILGYAEDVGGCIEVLWMKPCVGECARYAQLGEVIEAAKWRVDASPATLRRAG